MTRPSSPVRTNDKLVGGGDGSHASNDGTDMPCRQCLMNNQGNNLRLGWNFRTIDKLVTSGLVTSLAVEVAFPRSESVPAPEMVIRPVQGFLGANFRLRYTRVERFVQWNISAIHLPLTMIDSSRTSRAQQLNSYQEPSVALIELLALILVQSPKVNTPKNIIPWSHQVRICRRLP